MTKRCANCTAAGLIYELSEFELFCFSWFRSNVSQFAFDAHLVDGLVKELNLKNGTKPLFLRAVNMIYQNDLRISGERAKKEARKKPNV